MSTALSLWLRTRTGVAFGNLCPVTPAHASSRTEPKKGTTLIHRSLLLDARCAISTAMAGQGAQLEPGSTACPLDRATQEVVGREIDSGTNTAYKCAVPDPAGQCRPDSAQIGMMPSIKTHLSSPGERSSAEVWRGSKSEGESRRSGGMAYR